MQVSHHNHYTTQLHLSHCHIYDELGRVLYVYDILCYQFPTISYNLCVNFLFQARSCTDLIYTALYRGGGSRGPVG